MAGPTQSRIGTFRIALAAAITVTGPPIVLSAITKPEMQDIMDNADQPTLDALAQMSKVLESIKLGMQVVTEENLEVDS